MALPRQRPKDVADLRGRGPGGAGTRRVLAVRGDPKSAVFEDPPHTHAPGENLGVEFLFRFFMFYILYSFVICRHFFIKTYLLDLFIETCLELRTPYPDQVLTALEAATNAISNDEDLVVPVPWQKPRSHLNGMGFLQ